MNPTNSFRLIGNDWDEQLSAEFQKPYYQKLRAFLNHEYATYDIYPSAKDIYKALRLTSYQKTRVLILGQDPYHQPHQANGLAFSVNNNVALPPSLRNIYQEISKEFNCLMANNGDLSSWAYQGVLLLNATLTVRRGQPSSHANKGWEILTDEIIRCLNNKKTPLVFILWGKYARAKKKFITGKQYLILESSHPSPLSAYRGFFNNQHFLLTNAFLSTHQQVPIDWQIKK